MMKLFGFLACFFVLIGCTDIEQGNWEIIEGNVQDEQFPDSEIYFQSPDTGIFCGEVLKEQSIRSKSDQYQFLPRIVMTKTGGKSWVEIPTPPNVSGNIFSAICKDSVIVCLIDNILYKTSNLGRNWQSIFPGSIKPYNLNLRNERMAYFIHENTRDRYLLKYENEDWDTIHRLNIDRDYTFSNDALFSFPTNSDRIAQEITEENLSTGEVKKHQLQYPFKISFLAKLKEGLNVAIADNALIAMDSNGISTSYPEFLNKYIVKDLLSYNNLLICICFNRDERKEVLTDVYFISKDYGHTWQLLQKEFGSNRKRFLYKDSMLISYEYPYGMQKLKL